MHPCIHLQICGLTMHARMHPFLYASIPCIYPFIHLLIATLLPTHVSTHAPMHACTHPLTYLVHPCTHSLHTHPLSPAQPTSLWYPSIPGTIIGAEKQIGKLDKAPAFKEHTVCLQVPK